MSRLPAASASSSARVLVAGRVLAGLVALVALPGFVIAMGDVLAIT